MHTETAAGRTGMTPRRNAAEARVRAALRQFDDMPDAALLELAVARALLGISRPTLYRRAQAGELTITKVGAASRVRVADVRRLLGLAR
jgi:excisionase family DNA binding protein